MLQYDTVGGGITVRGERMGHRNIRAREKRLVFLRPAHKGGALGTVTQPSGVQGSLAAQAPEGEVQPPTAALSQVRPPDHPTLALSGPNPLPLPLGNHMQERTGCFKAHLTCALTF